MTQFLRLGAILAAIALGFGVMPSGLAQTGPVQDKLAIVKHRQNLMKQQADDLKIIKAYLNGTSGDKAAALTSVQDMIGVADKVKDLFLVGTSSADLPGKSDAKPDIWEQKDKFAALMAALNEGDRNLMDALQRDDKTAAGAEMADLGKNACGACHGSFREKS